MGETHLPQIGGLALPGVGSPDLLSGIEGVPTFPVLVFPSRQCRTQAEGLGCPQMVPLNIPVPE